MNQLIKFTYWHQKFWIWCISRLLYFYDTKRWLCLLFKAENVYSPFIIIAQNRAASTYSTPFSFVSLRKVSLFWNTVKLSNDECIFFFWVKSIRYYDNIGVDAQPYTQPHSITANLPKRDYVVLLVINEKHKASVGLLTPSLSYWFKCYSYPPMMCRADLPLRWIVLWLGVIECFSFHRHTSKVIRSPGILQQVLSLCVAEILDFFFNICKCAEQFT